MKVYEFTKDEILAHRVVGDDADPSEMVLTAVDNGFTVEGKTIDLEAITTDERFADLAWEIASTNEPDGEDVESDASDG